MGQLDHCIVIRARRELTTSFRLSIKAADQCIELLNLQQKTLQILFRHQLRSNCRDPDNPWMEIRAITCAASH
ncbi:MULTISPECIES: hypothetical protein [unclassified Synechococcus]|uniref:hypothetical protein n=1 Tax=unclassified Synechococcus TaxID=2626047 RepID=UPI0039AE9FD0